MRRWGDPSCTIRSAIVVVICLLIGFSVFDFHDWRDVAIRWKQISGPLSSSAIEELPGESSENHHVILAYPETAAGENPVAGSTLNLPDEAQAKHESTAVERETDDAKAAPPENSAPAPQQEQILQHEEAGEVGSPGPVEAEKLRTPPPSAQPAAAPAPPSVLPKEQTSLEKIEQSLRRARASIRQAVKGGKLKKAGAGEYVPSGNAYINAAFFHQSYTEMEKRFKIYAYEEGEEPLVHNGPCKEIYAVEGRFIQELQGDNPFLTKDAEQAHAFFLPFSVAMMVTYLYRSESHDFSPLERFVKDYIEVISQRHPYWNQSSGADHFMLTCHDWGPHISRVHRDLEHNAIRVICNANSSEGYVGKKDVSLPEINLIGGGIPAELGGPSLADRNYLAFFSGAEHGPVRPVLFEHWEGKDPDVPVFRSQNFPKDKSYHDFMKHSKFCLCPGGYEVNSPRIVEAIYNDCVPVIIADHFVLPFSDVLNWKSFSIHLSERDIPNLRKVLEKVSPSEYQDMQENVRRVQHHFLFNQPPQRYDVFHMILHSVWLRRLNIQIQNL